MINKITTLTNTKSGDFFMSIKWDMVVFLIGGVTYAMIEIMWRGNTHWTMVLLGGLCFLTLYKLLDI